MVFILDQHQWRSPLQGLPGWATRRAKMRKKISKVWGKTRKIDRNLRTKWGKWNLCPPGTVRLSTALISTLYDNFIVGRNRTHVLISLKLNFGLMLIFFGPVRSGENIIVSVRDQGHKIYFFFGRVRVGAKDSGALRCRGAKNLAPHDSNANTNISFSKSEYLIVPRGTQFTGSGKLYS